MEKSPVKSGKFGHVPPAHWEAILEDINDKFEIVKEVNQKVDSLTNEFGAFRNNMLDFKSETESSFETIKRFMSQVDLFELQERVERIEKHLELRK